MQIKLSEIAKKMVEAYNIDPQSDIPTPTQPPTKKVQEMGMNQHIYQVERNGKIQTIRSTNDALGVARGAFPDIKNKKITPVVDGAVTTIGDIKVTEISPFVG